MFCVRREFCGELKSSVRLARFEDWRLLFQFSTAFELDRRLVFVRVATKTGWVSEVNFIRVHDKAAVGCRGVRSHREPVQRGVVWDSIAGVRHFALALSGLTFWGFAVMEQIASANFPSEVVVVDGSSAFLASRVSPCIKHHLFQCLLHVRAVCFQSQGLQFIFTY